MVRIKGVKKDSSWWSNQSLTLLTLLFLATAFLGSILILFSILKADDTANNVRPTDGAGNIPNDQTSIQNLRSDWKQIYKEGTKTLRDWKKMGLQRSKSTLRYPDVDEEIARILQSARAEVDAETLSQLPAWNDVVSQYGTRPIVHGLERCEEYRRSVKPRDRMIGPAGIFNTGTNLFFQVMKENCDIREAALSKSHSEPRKNGIRYQVPWGKQLSVYHLKFNSFYSLLWKHGILPFSTFQ